MKKCLLVNILSIVLCVVLSQYSVSADVYLKKPNGTGTQELPSYPATFGTKLPQEGLKGMVVVVEPIDACHDVLSPPIINQSLPYVALIRRNNCEFDVKVLNVQTAGYLAAIVYNVGSNAILPMNPSKHGNEVVIPSVFVGEEDGLLLTKSDYKTGSTVTLYPYISFPSPLYYFVPFLAVCGTCLIFLLVYIIVKYLRDRRKLRRSRLSREHLKKLPIKKFKKGENYDVCAICLDEYNEGDKLRILPCNHAFHCPCIDPWLTNNKRTCPVCKRKVIPGDIEDDSSDSDDSDGENTPLLFGNRGGGRYVRPTGDTDPLEGTSSQYSAAEEEESTIDNSVVESTTIVSLEVESDGESNDSYEMQNTKAESDNDSRP
ncbi:E3 ubiquitin-protein ligase RNF13-like [Antedon mediterranea]|uniref:E3 ubiquitin-protein ligase RNF13-like n=1 Tax=Antedon mediterranea TaxID=105859 RepID=UPI003AF4255D